MKRVTGLGILATLILISSTNSLCMQNPKNKKNKKARQNTFAPLAYSENTQKASQSEQSSTIEKEFTEIQNIEKLTPQVAPGTLQKEVDKEKSWIRFSSRNVRGTALDLLKKLDPKKEVFGSGEDAENNNFLNATFTSFEKNKTSDDINNCVTAVALCCNKNIPLNAAAQETAKKTCLTALEQRKAKACEKINMQTLAAQAVLTQRIQNLKEIYESEQNFLLKTIIEETDYVGEALTAINFLENPAAQKTEKNNKENNLKSLLKTVEISELVLLKEDVAQELATIAKNPKLKLKQD